MLGVKLKTKKSAEIFMALRNSGPSRTSQPSAGVHMGIYEGSKRTCQMVLIEMSGFAVQK